MRTFNLVILCLSITACAHTRVASWKEKEIVVCGNAFSGVGDFNKTAGQSCGGGYRAIAGGESHTGGYSAKGSRLVAEKETCVTYRCN